MGISRFSDHAPAVEEHRVPVFFIASLFIIACGSLLRISAFGMSTPKVFTAKTFAKPTSNIGSSEGLQPALRLRRLGEQIYSSVKQIEHGNQ
jgi:hypothetical protein